MRIDKPNIIGDVTVSGNLNVTGDIASPSLQAALDGYATGTGGGNIPPGVLDGYELSSNHNLDIKAVVDACDGYGRINSQQSIWNDIIRETLDGYGTVTAANGMDGYLAFFTGSQTIAGDGYLTYDNVLKLLSSNIDCGVWSSAGPFTVLLTSGSSYTFTSCGKVKIWAIGGGGGGAGTPSADNTAGGGGGAGGITYKVWTSITGNQTLTYSVGSGGSGGYNGANGSGGGTTTATLLSTTLTANGGTGGYYNTGANAAGGSYSGGDGGATGGTGGGASGDMGGGGGGGLGTANVVYGSHSDGQNGAQSNDVGGLQSEITADGYSWTTYGSGATHVSGDNDHGGAATGFGCGGGGANFFGGNGGNGKYGGGGGGSASYTIARTGGTGGTGVVILKTYF